MARPLQKKKNKSSLHRVRQKPKSKRINVKSNPIVAANWDQTQTLSRNYHRLGLSSKLNARTGGTEFKLSHPISTSTSTSTSKTNTLEIPSSKAPKFLGAEEVAVSRDPETGAILSVHSATNAEKRARRNPLNDPLNESSDDYESGQEEGDDGEGQERETGMGGGGRGIIRDLEAASRVEKKKRVRVQSEREREWCRRLVERWGGDWGGMSRDRKLNPMQQSEGDLRRRVGLYMREGGGEGEG